MTTTTLDETIAADTRLAAALRPLNRRRRVTLGRVREFFPTVGEWSSPVLSSEVVFDPSASRPFTCDGKRIVVGNESFRYLDSTRRLGKAFATACDELETQIGIREHASETRAVRYAAAETLPLGTGATPPGGAKNHKVGETKTVNGVTYRLNENHRWELADQSQEHAAGIHGQATQDVPPIDQQATQAPSPGGQPGSAIGGPDFDAAKPPPAGQKWKGQPSPVDQTTHEDRHKFVVGQLGKIDGPAKGAILAMQQSPEYKQGGEYATTDFAPEQAGKLYGWMKQSVGQQVSGGQVVDLGQGRLGFSSPAGAIVVWPPDANGRQKVGYTNATGIVAQGMGVGSPAGGGGGDAGGTVGGQPAGVPEGQQGQPPVEPSAPPVAESGQPPAVPPAAETPSATADETPAGEPPVAPPVDPRPLRQQAEVERERLNQAIASYAEATQRGLDGRGHARWKQYISALKRIWGEKNQEANRGEREEKKTGREARQQEKNRRREQESAARKAETEKERQGRKAKQAERESEREAARKTKAGRQAEREKLRAMGLKPGKTPPVHGRDLHGKNVAAAERDAARRKSASEGKGNQPRPLIDAPPGEGGKGHVPEPSPEAMERAKLPKRQAKLHTLADNYLKKFNVNPSPENKKLVSDAIKSGRIKNPRDIRTVLRTAKKLHERGNLADADHPHVKEAIRRKVNREGRESWKLTKAKQAESWGMEPDQYEEIARDVWKEHAERHQEREAAKEHARKLTGLSAKDVRQLEELGFDSGSEHPQIAKFDEAASSIAAAHPGLGWGEGSSAEGKEVDHGEKLWALLREGAKPIPGKTSPEFLQFVDDYLESRQRSAASSSGGSGAAGDDDLSAVPFKRREGGKAGNRRRTVKRHLTYPANPS